MKSIENVGLKCGPATNIKHAVFWINVDQPVLVALSVVDVVRTVVPAGVLLVWPGIELGLGSLAAGCTDPPHSITL